MASNKNQHYVPRTHFKPFTLNEEGMSINLVNIERMRAISNAPVKNQCSGDYFYGKDDKLEKAINSVENLYAEVVPSLMGVNDAVNAKMRIAILRFVYLQYLRTEAASRKASEITSAVQSVPGSDIPPIDMRVAMKAAVQTAMYHYAKTMHIIDDLKLCIVRNHTNQPFFTSDDPAVLTNRLHIQRKNKILRKFGVKTAGAIFFLPLNTKLCAILYDPAVYRISQKNGWVNIYRSFDIDAINEHQVLNCKSNLYFKDWSQAEYLLEQIQKLQPRRILKRHNVVYAALDYKTRDGIRYTVKETTNLQEDEEVLIHIIANHPEPSSWPSFLRFRPDAKAYSNNTGAGLTRKWCLEQGFVTGYGYSKVRV